MSPWHASKGRRHGGPCATLLVALQKESAAARVCNGVVCDALQQLCARETQATAPKNPDLVDVQAAVSSWYHTCWTTVGVARKTGDCFADQKAAMTHRGAVI